MAMDEQLLEQTQTEEERPVYGVVVATGVSLEDYLAHYAADFCEWIDGVVIRMSPAELKHNKLIAYLLKLFEAYFELRPIGEVVFAPFVVRLPAFPNRRREPDLLVVLHTNPGELKATYMDGPPDICIEVVSAESVERDHGEKFREYEQGGVPEYWIIDPLHTECRFYRLNPDGLYTRQEPDSAGDYATTALPGLKLRVPLLWQETLPGPAAVVAAVQAMLKE
jgi:Uma2 family endonuclease